MLVLLRISTEENILCVNRNTHPTQMILRPFMRKCCMTAQEIFYAKICFIGVFMVQFPESLKPYGQLVTWMREEGNCIFKVIFKALLLQTLPECKQLELRKWVYTRQDNFSTKWNTQFLHQTKIFSAWGKRPCPLNRRLQNFLHIKHVLITELRGHLCKFNILYVAEWLQNLVCKISKSASYLSCLRLHCDSTRPLWHQ